MTPVGMEGSMKGWVKVVDAAGTLAGAAMIVGWFMTEWPTGWWGAGWSILVLSGIIVWMETRKARRQEGGDRG